MEALVTLLKGKISLMKLAITLLLFAGLYLFAGEERQAALDAVVIAGLPRGSLKFLVFLTASYLMVEFFGFIFLPMLRQYRQWSSRVDAVSAARLSAAANELIWQFQLQDFQPLSLQVDLREVMELSSKRVISRVSDVKNGRALFALSPVFIAYYRDLHSKVS